MKTTTPTKTVTKAITVPVQDSFTGSEFEAKGTVILHKYASGVKMLFAKVKTPYGLGTLKLSCNPAGRWVRDAQQSPSSWLAPQWNKISETLCSLASL